MANLKAKYLDEQFAENRQVGFHPSGVPWVQAEVGTYKIHGTKLTLHFTWIAEQINGRKWRRLQGPMQVTMNLPHGLEYMMGMRYASFNDFRHPQLAPHGEGVLYFENSAGELSPEEFVDGHIGPLHK